MSPHRRPRTDAELAVSPHRRPRTDAELADTITWLHGRPAATYVTTYRREVLVDLLDELRARRRRDETPEGGVRVPEGE